MPAAFILISLVLLQVFVMLSTSVRVQQDIVPYEASSFVLVLRTTGDGTLSTPRQNSACDGILSSIIRLASSVADKVKTAAFTCLNARLFDPLNTQTGCNTSVAPCSETVSRK